MRIAHHYCDAYFQAVLKEYDPFPSSAEREVTNGSHGRGFAGRLEASRYSELRSRLAFLSLRAYV